MAVLIPILVTHTCSSLCLDSLILFLFMIDNSNMEEDHQLIDCPDTMA